MEYGLKYNEVFIFVLAAIENFTKYGFGVPLKSKAAQTMTNYFFSNNIHNFNR